MIADRKVVVISAVVVMGFVSGIGAAAAPNSDSGNEFSNNLLSDLAPYAHLTPFKFQGLLLTIPGSLRSLGNNSQNNS